MEDEDIKCKECPSARHGFDRHASHNAGRYVCECESFVCPSEQLRQRVQELENERDGLIAKNQNLFNALMLSTQKKDSMYMTIKAASGHLNLYGLFSCVEGDSYDPECADKNVRKANSILKAELTTEVIKPAGKEDQAVCDSILRNYYK